MQIVSPSGGQKSNPAEPSIRRIKGLWKSIFKDPRAIKGLTFLQLDFLLNACCADLTTIPLNPTVSALSPSDFQMGYKQLPLNIDMQGNAGKRAMETLKNGYAELCKRYKFSHLTCPYLWTKRQSGRLRRKVSVGDLAYIQKIERMGKIVNTRRNQVEVYFRDASNSPHRIWYPKDSLTLMAKGSQLTPQALPSCLETEVGPLQPLHSGVSDEKVPPTNE